MKKFLLIAIISCITSCVFSQATYINSNTTGKFVRKLTTTNATATTIDTIFVANDEVGSITIKALGYRTDSTGACTGVRTYRYKKIGGTLTLGSVIETDPIVNDTPLFNATFTAVATNNQIYIKVTGRASQTVYWNVQTSKIATKTSTE